MSSSSFSCFLAGLVDQSSLRAVHPRSARVARKGMKNTYAPMEDWPPAPPLELASSSTRTTLRASTGDILSSLITSRAYTVELPDSVCGSNLMFQDDQSFAEDRSAACFQSPPPTITSTNPTPGTPPVEVPDTLDSFPRCSSVTIFIETFNEESIAPAACTKDRGSAWPYPNSLSGRVSKTLQSLNPGSSRSWISRSIERALMIDLTCSWSISGFASTIKAAIPAMRGVAILVPDLLV